MILVEDHKQIVEGVLLAQLDAEAVEGILKFVHVQSSVSVDVPFFGKDAGKGAERSGVRERSRSVRQEQESTGARSILFQSPRPVVIRERIHQLLDGHLRAHPRVELLEGDKAVVILIEALEELV